MERPNVTAKSEVIRKINELYVLTRFKYITQHEDGTYSTYDQRKSKKVRPFNDGLLRRYLQGRKTYGIFSGGYYSKFLTFDVDCANRDDIARWATFKIIMLLTEEYGVWRNDIHVSTSGRKGYHVDLFFDRPVLVTDLQRFFTAVVADVGELPVGKIEFRPSWGAGVKLPLGVHQVTGNRCWYVDRDTLEPIESFDYILDVEPMSAEIITDQDIGLTEEQAAEFEYIARTVDPNANVLTERDALHKAKRVLDAGRLTESGTRHSTTVLLASFFNVHGWAPEEAVEAILSVLHNTPRDYFNKDSTPEHWEKETRRLVKLAYERDYQLGNENKEIRVYKSEILEVLKCGTFRTRQMAFAMLVTSKRYNRVFKFSWEIAKKMVGTNSNETVRKTIKRLEQAGFIEVVRRGELDKAASREKGRAHYKPNKYRLLIDEPAQDEPSILVTDADDMVGVAKSLLTDQEIKRYVKRYEYDNRWRA